MRVAPLVVKRLEHTSDKADVGSGYTSSCQLSPESLKSIEFMRIASQALWLVHVV